jgi:hypothetical protein
MESPGISGQLAQFRLARSGKKHPQPSSEKTKISTKRQSEWINTMFPTLRAQLNTIRPSELHLPVPFTLSEVGIADKAEVRLAGHANHAATTPLLALFECLSFAEYDGRYRWCFQVLARYRDRHEGPLLEIFFSRLAQSYAWLGGVNIKAAGVSSKRADTMTYEDRVKAHGSLDYEEMDKNIELAEETLRAFKFVQGDAERTENKKKVDEIRRELKELELQ